MQIPPSNIKSNTDMSGFSKKKCTVRKMPSSIRKCIILNLASRFCLFSHYLGQGGRQRANTFRVFLQKRRKWLVRKKCVVCGTCKGQEKEVREKEKGTLCSS